MYVETTVKFLLTPINMVMSLKLQEITGVGKSAEKKKKNLNILLMKM